MIREEEFHLGPAAEGGDSALQAAWRDYWRGINLYSIWSMLALQDILQRYRRSVIGPFWLIISTAIMVGTLGFVYSSLFRQEIYSYLPFLAIGMIIWGFISTVISESCTVFISVEGMMKQLRLPLTVHVARMVWRNSIIFAHSLIALIVLIFWVDTPLTVNLWLVPLVCFFYFFNALNIGLFLGVICTRFRDVGPLIANLMQILFFITPIIWSPQILTDNRADLAWIANYNPAYHFIEIFRSPLLGKDIPQNSWSFVITTTVVLWGVQFWILKNFRHRVAFWL